MYLPHLAPAGMYGDMACPSKNMNRK